MATNPTICDSAAFALPQKLAGCSHLPTHPGTSNQDLLLNCKPCPPIAELVCKHISFSCLHHICYPATCSWVELAWKPTKGGWLEMLPSLGKPFDHSLANAAITATILIKIQKKGWPFPEQQQQLPLQSLPKSSSAPFSLPASYPGHSHASLLQDHLFCFTYFL